jgi:hypothetical protein
MVEGSGTVRPGPPPRGLGRPLDPRQKISGVTEKVDCGNDRKGLFQ